MDYGDVEEYPSTHELVFEGAAGYASDSDYDWDMGSSSLHDPLGEYQYEDIENFGRDMNAAEEWDSSDADLLSSPPPQQLHHYDLDHEIDEDDEDQVEEDEDDEDQVEEDEEDDAGSIDLEFSSPRSEATPGPEEVYEEDEQEDEEEDHHPFVLIWDQQQQNLEESRRFITEALGRYTEQRSRFWQDTLGSGRNDMSTAPGTDGQHAAQPSRSRDTDAGQPGRSDRRRNPDQQATAPDHLVAVEVGGPGRQTSSRRRRQGVGGGARTETRSVPVIDLTGEPDSPAATRNTNTLTFPRPGVPSTSTSSHSHRRRQMPPNNHPPTLARTNVAGFVDFIDLTGDDDPPPPRTVPPARLHRSRPPRHAAIPAHVQPVDLELEEARNINNTLFGLITGVAGNFRRFVESEILNNPLGNNRPDLNYQGNGYNNGNRGASSGKPAHVPPPKAREGFTRNTTSGDSGNTDETDVFVCPACEEELAYDPDEEGGKATLGKGRPTPKKARTKKDREEHHFWAVKECGHVFCKKCFDTRTKRTNTKTHDMSKFRLEPAPSKKVLCAVDGCKSEVAKTSSWVGLFL